MPIKVSKALIKKLPQADRDRDVKQLLWDKSGGTCFLCDGDLNRARDEILPDHDLPEAEGGETALQNLNLTHKDCNSFKRNHTTTDVRPFLGLLRFLRAPGRLPSPKYGDCLEHFAITPTPSEISVRGRTVSLRFGDGQTARAPIHSERTRDGTTFAFAFVDLPRTAIFNDNKCQPRSIKTTHLWAIYLDLVMNPLHEPPGCRRVPANPSSALERILLFDGQHKTLAYWLHGRESIVAKLYLDLPLDKTIKLVNSVQAKIKKLPLSPFELSAKMAEEWQDRWDAYRESASTEDASEAGFFQWIGKDERTRAKAAFQDALVQSVLDSEELVFQRKYVAQPGTKKKDSQVTEATFRNKVLKQLLHMNPLAEPFEAAQRLRERERETIVRLLNTLTEGLFEPGAGNSLSRREAERARRCLYQSSLQYIAGLLRRAVGHLLVVEAPREFLEKELGPDHWARLETYVERLLNHPVWFGDFDDSDKMRAVEDALSKNQDAQRAFGDCDLKLGYVVGADEVGEDSIR